MTADHNDQASDILDAKQADLLRKLDPLAAIAAVRTDDLRAVADGARKAGGAKQPLDWSPGTLATGSFTTLDYSPGTLDAAADDDGTGAGDGGLAGVSAALAAAARALDGDGRLMVIVDTNNAEEMQPHFDANARLLTPTKIAAAIEPDDLMRFAAMDEIRRIEVSAPLPPAVNQAHAASGVWQDADEPARSPAIEGLDGRGVLVGVIDTGIDGSHPDFWESGRSRLVDFWDQKHDIFRTAGDNGVLSADDAGACTDENGHGSHVAGIAAGNGRADPRFAGVAPGADLAVVKTSFMSRDIAAGVSHIFALADKRGQPCVINLSLGGHWGAHDGSSVTERVIDELCDRPGRIVVAAAGNEGTDRAHAAISFRELPPGPSGRRRWTADFEIQQRVIRGRLVGTTLLQIWTQREDQLEVVLRTPFGELIKPPVNNARRFDGDYYLIETWNDNSSLSGDDQTTIAITTQPVRRLLEGWSVIVREPVKPAGASPTDTVPVGVVHAWIADGGARFNEAFTRSHQVGMPGTAFSAITVAAYGTRNSWPAANGVDTTIDGVKAADIAYFSSRGPTRDQHNKPEICAPGQWIVSVRSEQADMPERMLLPDGLYAAMQGTSMAAPYVTGAMALLLQREPELSWAEAKRRLIKSARQDEFTYGCWNPAWGYGKLDVAELLRVNP